MSSRQNFLRAFIEAATADSSENRSVGADSGFQGASTNTFSSSASRSNDSGIGRGVGRGRARFIAAFAESCGISQEQPRPNPAVVGRGRFLKMVIEKAEEEQPRQLEPVPAVDDAARQLETVAAVDDAAEKLASMTVQEKQVAPERQKAAPSEKLASMTVQEKQVAPERQKAAPSVGEQVKESVPKEPVVRTGTAGTSATLLCNFMELRCDPGRGIYLYTVNFEPMLDSKNERYRCIEANAHIFGKTYTFDGMMILLPQALPEKTTVINMSRPLDGTPVQLTAIFRGKKRMSENVMFYNKLFRRIMGFLQLTEIGRKNFDPTQARIVPQHKLEVWPGYVTAVNEFEGGLMLNLDITHRVLMQTTVYDHIKMTSLASPAQYRENLLKALLGVVVFTRYNKKTYRIDEVCFDETPLSTFRYGDRDITYVQYYKQQYDIDIMDHRQPLLLHRAERRVSGEAKPQEMLICLVPEICHLTGLTDEMRNDFKVMRDIATHTRVTPNQRMQAMEQFCKNVNSNEKARTLLASWGLELMTKARMVAGRTLPNEKITFGNNAMVSAGPQADFNNHITNNYMLEVVHIRNWLLVHTARNDAVAKVFLDQVKRNCQLIGIQISQPQMVALQQDGIKHYVDALRASIRPDTQIVVVIFPTAREDRYAAIKRVCCAEIPVPTQMINARTLQNDKRVRSIVLKIILQMNCKLGGTLWGVNIPLNDTMICGIDTYHEARCASSVAAFVGSLDPAFTHWYSRATMQSSKEELTNGLCVSFEHMLRAYKRRNCQLPARVIIYRDGVGDSQLAVCEDYEVQQLEAACEMVQPGYRPKLTFIVVQKRIIMRMFSTNRSGSASFDNPPPGTVLDHTVTRRYLFDFFLVSQCVRQGTVSPTHYVVLRDDSAFAPDILQKLSYKLCYMYYNWPGSVRVPACCQYAHKLAYLVGQSIKRAPAESLSDKLYYL